MATRTTSISDLLNRIHNDHEIVLPDIQREFVWERDQVRLLFDSLMRGFPFGSLLLWQTRHVEVMYREFVVDYFPSTPQPTKDKAEGEPKLMVLDGQQRLQSFYIAVHGTHEGRRLYFNVTSGPQAPSMSGEDELEEREGATYRFEFWRDDDTNRPNRLVRVADVVAWRARDVDDRIDDLIERLKLEGDEARQARRNLARLQRIVNESDLVPVVTIDEEAQDRRAAHTIDEVVEMFVRVNSGGTRLSRSDLMFSLLKSRWRSARWTFDELIRAVDPVGVLGIDKDFVIRGLLTVADKPPSFDVDNIRRHHEAVEAVFPLYSDALRAVIDFCRDTGLPSAGLLQPTSTLHPLVYYVSRQPGTRIPDDQREALRTVLYFLLFNRFLRGTKPDARIRYLREVFQLDPGGRVPLANVLHTISQRQKYHHIQTSAGMLSEYPQLALSIVQPTVARRALTWESKPEVDHIFPQSLYREEFPELVDDIGNLAYLGKLRNIRKSNQQPWEYFAETPDDELRDDFLIERAQLRKGGFEKFVAHRRQQIVARAHRHLGR
jgi:hypothetical protein